MKVFLNFSKNVEVCLKRFMGTLLGILGFLKFSYLICLLLCTTINCFEPLTWSILIIRSEMR